MIGQNRKFAPVAPKKSKMALLQEEVLRLREDVQRLESALSSAGWWLQNAREERERQSYGDWDRMGR